MLDTIKHRGPDAINIATYGRFGFGVARLSIEALLEGSQPIVDDRFILGFNGEIFNYKTIIKSENLNKHEINSEVKLLLFMWKKYKTNFVNYIKGQFSIFVYDKISEEIFLFRDRYGIRPLYYFKKNKEFYFCSEIKGIFKATRKHFSINETALAQVAMFWTTIGSETAFNGIKQLEPGSFLKWKNGEIEIKKYWKNPIFNDLILEKNIINLKEYIFDSLKKSVSNQLHSEVGYASYLSGGIDSSALALILNQLSNKKLDTFSLSFEDKSYDEFDAQMQVSNYLGTNHHTLKIKNEDIPKNFSKVINHAETFLFRTAPVPMYMLSKEVNKKGHKVVFSGEGADEILLGYDLFFENRIRKFWSKYPNSLIRPNLLKKLYYYLPQFRNTRYFAILKDFYKSTLTEVNNVFYSHLVRWSQFNQVISHFNLSEDRKNLEEKLILNFCKSLPSDFNNLESDRKAQIIEIDTLLNNYLLSSQGDRMSMANSVETRVPFICEDFSEKIATIDRWNLSKGIKTKRLFRESMDKYLPKAIVERPKVAYQAPEAKSFLNHGYISNSAKELKESISNLSLIKSNSYLSLETKICNPYSSERLGFRENMSYILMQSYNNLSNCSNEWRK